MNEMNLLQHQINKFGVVTVMDVLLKDPETKQPVLFLDTLKITSINQEASTKEIRGGIGAPQLINYDYARNVTLEIQDALASLGSLQLLWGGDFIDGDVDYTAVFSAHATEDAGTVSIAIPAEITIGGVADEILIIDGLNGKTYNVTAIAGQSLTLDLTAVPAGNPELKVFVPATAAASVESGVAALAIKSTSMPPTVEMTGLTFFIDQATGKKVNMEITVPLLKINTSGGLAMEAEGDAAVFDFNGVALADSITKNFFVLKSLGKTNE